MSKIREDFKNDLKQIPQLQGKRRRFKGLKVKGSKCGWEEEMISGLLLYTGCFVH